MITRKILTIALLAISSASFAQIEPIVVTEEMIPESRMEQQDQFNAGDYDYPAKPRSKWNIGVSLGVPYVTGDVATDPFGGHDGLGMGFGLNVRKGWGYLVSVRAHGNYGVTYGQNYTPVTYTKNDRINGSLALDSSFAYDAADYQSTASQYIPNYKTTAMSGGLDFIVNLNNVSFHKEASRFLPYVFGGVGLMSYNVKYNALDANGNIYDYDTLIITYRDVEEREPEVDALMDDTYETQADFDGNTKNENDPSSLRVTGDFGGGVLWRLGSKGNFEVGVEHRLSWTGDDLLDGQRWELGETQTSATDFFHFTALTLGVNIGKNAQQPLWEVNPLGFIYSKLSEFDIANILADADDDGVLDYLDREPNTPAGTPVDTHGVALDSDKDGCPDSEDPEPFSTPNMPIENCQNVFVTENRVNEIIDERLKLYVPGGNSGTGGNWYLPMIFFDLDKTNIRPDAVASLANVGDIMKQYSKLNVEVVGYADTRASESYNLKLSEDRAKAAIQYLTSKGVDQSRFVMKYEGETNNLIPDAKREAEHQMNRRVEFHIVK